MDKHSITLDEFMYDVLQDEELAKEYLNNSFMNYIEDGDFNMFFKTLERIVKARMSVREFAKQAEIDRAHLYAIFNGKKKPQFRTVLKILAKLGYTLRVA
jgi:probable addiction module antidote protein